MNAAEIANARSRMDVIQARVDDPFTGMSQIERNDLSVELSLMRSVVNEAEANNWRAESEAEFIATQRYD